MIRFSLIIITVVSVIIASTISFIANSLFSLDTYYYSLEEFTDNILPSFSVLFFLTSAFYVPFIEEWVFRGVLRPFRWWRVIIIGIMIIIEFVNTFFIYPALPLNISQPTTLSFFARIIFPFILLIFYATLQRALVFPHARVNILWYGVLATLFSLSHARIVSAAFPISLFFILVYGGVLFTYVAHKHSLRFAILLHILWNTLTFIIPFILTLLLNSIDYQIFM